MAQTNIEPCRIIFVKCNSNKRKPVAHAHKVVTPEQLRPRLSLQVAVAQLIPYPTLATYN